MSTAVKPLRFHVEGSQRSATDEQTGLHFVITHLDRSDGQPGYEIEQSESKNPGGRIRFEFVERLDTARALCNQRVADRLSTNQATS